MIKHIILWTLKDSLTDLEKTEVKLNIKKELETLTSKIPGIISLEVNINGIDGSTADLMLDSCFESIEALKNYAINPFHVEVANTYVRPYTAIRDALDYEK
ncbi:MAG: Dabb family protein [Erysipelotrichaceae bacterium]